MRLTEKEQAMLNGEMGPGFARAMRVLVGIGKAFGAERMVPISRGHISLSNQEGDLWFVSETAGGAGTLYGASHGQSRL